MFDKIKTLFSNEEKLETVPMDAGDGWQPESYNPEVDPYGDGHEEDGLNG